MESVSGEEPRTYTIRRSQHLGYGFVAGYESPTMVKTVEPNGPSFKRLLQGDVIMAVNGIDVERAPRERIIKMIQLCGDQIKITVRQATYEELIRAKNLADPKFYTLNKSPNQNFPINHPSNRQPALPPNPSPLNRLVTSISQQQKSSPSSPFAIENGDTPPVQIKPSAKAVLKQKSINGTELDSGNNNARTLGRNNTNYGRHSPLPQRCKSSMEGTRKSNSNKNPNDSDNDQPMLKRSNTMRPIKPPSKVMEIFEVVIKIFFEVGHTRVLNYNQDTTVAAILETLNARLIGDSPHSEQIKRYFGLALTVNTEDGPKEQLPKRLHILNENDSIMKIRLLPYAPRLRLLYRMVYPPSDISELYSQHKVAFEYLYQQSCNDVKLERFYPELDQDTALKLSALHLLEYVYSNHSKAHGNSKDPKVYVKLIKKSPGIEYFLPSSIAETIVDKKGKKNVGRYKKLETRLKEQLKKNFEEFDFQPPKVKSTTNLNRYSSTSFHELSLPEMTSSPCDYIKLLFLNYLSQLPCYGNSKRPIRTPTSPERNSAGDCSSSLESVPRTSDSSPLIRQDRIQNNTNHNNYTNGNNVSNGRADSMSRLAQMNSMRSPHPSSICQQPVDQPDIAQTPSIESISSITFNMQNSPSPQQTPLFPIQHQNELNHIGQTNGRTLYIEPSPMPRQQHLATSQEYKSIERLYNQRYIANSRPIEELLKKVILSPPPPPSSRIYVDLRSNGNLTRVLTDKDIEQLRVPPPPRMYN